MSEQTAGCIWAPRSWNEAGRTASPSLSVPASTRSGSSTLRPREDALAAIEEAVTASPAFELVRAVTAFARAQRP
jgi:hypothetical protein